MESEHTKFGTSEIPLWSIPRLLRTAKEILMSGSIIEMDLSDPDCIQLISKGIGETQRYRVDLISKSGSTTTYTNEEGYKLIVMQKHGLLLETVFGPPSPSTDPSRSFSRLPKDVSEASREPPLVSLHYCPSIDVL